MDEDNNYYDYNNGKKATKSHPKSTSRPLTKPKYSMDTNNNSNKRANVPRTFSSGDANMAYNQKRLLDRRRRKKTNRQQQSVAQLWFKAQSQLKQGRNPPILAKYNITLTNIRQHNPRFKDYQRRKSHHEKAATYLQVTGGKLHTNMMMILVRQKMISI